MMWRRKKHPSPSSGWDLLPTATDRFADSNKALALAVKQLELALAEARRKLGESE